MYKCKQICKHVFTIQLYVCLPIFLCICLMHLFAFSAICLFSIYLSSRLSVKLPVYVSICLSFCYSSLWSFADLSISLSPTCLSFRLSSCFSSHLSVYPPISYPFACPSISTIYLSDSLSFHLDSLTACSCHAHTKHTVLLANSRDMWKCNWDTVKSEAFLRDLLTF